MFANYRAHAWRPLATLEGMTVVHSVYFIATLLPETLTKACTTTMFSPRLSFWVAVFVPCNGMFSSNNTTLKCYGYP